MTLWLVLGAMTALAAVLVAWPLLRPGATPSARRDYELQVYRAQLAELERECERGLVSERDAAAARLEIERRMLAADAASRRSQEQPGGASGRRWAAAALAGLALVAVGLYGSLGRPDLPSQPFAGRAEERTLAEGGDSGVPSVEELVARLEQRVAEHADDLEAWRRLGKAYDLVGRYDDAVTARRRVLALDGSSAEAHASLGEALVMANAGIVTPAAAEAFDQALALDASDPRARFYHGLALLQGGDRQGALDAWTALVESSPAGSPWLPELQRRIVALAAELGIDAADLPQPAPAALGPTAQQMRAAEDMAPGDQAAMIQDMVAGLAARLEDEPGDLDGWRRLGRSYQVLGEAQKAADSYRHVADALPGDLQAQLDYADALLAATPPEQALPPAVAEQLRRVLALDGQNPLALFYLGQAAVEAGDAATARDHWQRLIAQVPPDAPERARLQRLLDQLPPG